MRQYDCGSTYEPVPDDQRKQSGPVHRGEEGTWWQCRWYPTLQFVPEDERGPVPETVSDWTVGSHPWGCGCVPCQRPNAGHEKRKDRARERAAQMRTRELSRTSSSD